jgi:hypothetical protein
MARPIIPSYANEHYRYLVHFVQLVLRPVCRFLVAKGRSAPILTHAVPHK